MGTISQKEEEGGIVWHETLSSFYEDKAANPDLKTWILLGNQEYAQKTPWGFVSSPKAGQKIPLRCRLGKHLWKDLVKEDRSLLQDIRFHRFQRCERCQALQGRNRFESSSKATVKGWERSIPHWNLAVGLIDLKPVSIQPADAHQTVFQAAGGMYVRVTPSMRAGYLDIDMLNVLDGNDLKPSLPLLQLQASFENWSIECHHGDPAAFLSHHILRACLPSHRSLVQATYDLACWMALALPKDTHPELVWEQDLEEDSIALMHEDQRESPLWITWQTSSLRFHAAVFPKGISPHALSGLQQAWAPGWDEHGRVAPFRRSLLPSSEGSIPSDIDGYFARMTDAARQAERMSLEARFLELGYPLPDLSTYDIGWMKDQFFAPVT